MLIRTITNPRPKGLQAEASYIYIFQMYTSSSFLAICLTRKTKSMPDKFTTKTVTGGSKCEHLF